MLAQAAGTQVATIRYYAREGLLPPPSAPKPTTASTPRATCNDWQFIRHCRCLDMSLDEIRTLLEYKDAPADNCGNVNLLSDQHIDQVGNRICQLQALKKELRVLVRAR